MGLLGGEGQGGGGVAYAAHIGGFLAGLLLIKLFDRGVAARRMPEKTSRRFWV
jgi:membrane associated rhomboid family serine protease